MVYSKSGEKKLDPEKKEDVYIFLAKTFFTYSLKENNLKNHSAPLIPPLKEFFDISLKEGYIQKKDGNRYKYEINDNFWKMFSEDIEVKATIVANAPSDDKFWQLVKKKIFEVEYDKNYNDILEELEEKRSTIDRLVEEKKELFDENYEIQQELKEKEQEADELKIRLSKKYKDILNPISEKDIEENPKIELSPKYGNNRGPVNARKKVVVYTGEGYEFMDDYEGLNVTKDPFKPPRYFSFINEEGNLSQSAIIMYKLYKGYDTKKLNPNALGKLIQAGLTTGSRKEKNLGLTEKGEEIIKILMEKKLDWFKNII